MPRRVRRRRKISIAMNISRGQRCRGASNTHVGRGSLHAVRSATGNAAVRRGRPVVSNVFSTTDRTFNTTVARRKAGYTGASDTSANGLQPKWRHTERCSDRRR